MSQAARIAADQFADAVGEARSKIKVIDPSWKAKLGEVCKIELHATGWPAEATLTLEDLGIEPKNEAERKALTSVLSLGVRYLLPKSVIQEGVHWRNAFRNVLWRYAIKTSWGPLVHQSKYAQWKAETESVAASYKSYAESVYDNWDANVAQVRADYTTVAKRNYSTLKIMHRIPMLYWRANAGNVLGGREMTSEEYIDSFVSRMMAKMETRDYWLAKARMWWDVSYLPLKDMLDADDDVMAWAVKQAKSEMEKDILNSAHEQFQTGLFQFVSEVRGEITNRVFNVMADVLEAVNKNDGTIPRNSSKQLKNLIEAVESLKFWDEPTLDAQMNAIRGMLNVPAHLRSKNDVANLLRSVGAEARVVLVELERPIERRTSHLGITDGSEPIEPMRKARNLTFTDDETPVVLKRQPRKLEVATV